MGNNNTSVYKTKNNTKKDEIICECGKLSEYMISIPTTYILKDLDILSNYTNYTNWIWGKWFLKAYPCYDCANIICEKLTKKRINYIRGNSI
jgi:hypothetical protein